MASDERTAELHWQSATTLAQQIKRKKVSPVEVVDAILARIDKLNPTLNAMSRSPPRRRGARRGRPSAR